MTGSHSKPFAENMIVRISVGMLIVMGSGLAWLVTLSAQTNANTVEIKDVKDDQKAYLKNLEDIKLQLSNIQGGLGIRYKSVNQGR